MDASDLNIRIAKIRGWTEVHEVKWFVNEKERSGWVGREPNRKKRGFSLIPNWSGTLDLMHELIMELSGQDIERYLMHLREIVYPVDLDFAVCDQHVIGAYKRQIYEPTAAQKAEAYCRAKEGQR